MVLTMGLMIHLFPILTEAGGYFGDWRGRPTIHGNEAISTTHFKVGMLKAPFMALVIGVVACAEGFAVSHVRPWLLHAVLHVTGRSSSSTATYGFASGTSWQAQL